jgi:4-hydroxybutyryl-CoA dehydratase/vinylacetyl-CoA-Delta-isomerase
MRPNVYKFGELIEDVTTHPATRRAVESHCLAYDAANDPELEDIYTTASIFTGEKILRWNSMMQSAEALIGNMHLKRQNYRRSGTCTGMDEEFGTDYQARLKKWIVGAQERGITVAGALTDAKGNRKLRPSQQSDPFTIVRIKEKRKDGIVIAGAKAMICGTASSNEIFLLPGTAYGPDDEDCALACAIPRDIEGLTVVEARGPSDGRDLDTPSGYEVPETGVTQGWLLLEDVFVPNERVFLCGEAKYTGKVVGYFSANYRACIGACSTGHGDVMVGSATAMARANGLSAKPFTAKLVDMSVKNQTTFGMGAGACALGKSHPSGSYFADEITAHSNKVLVATLPYEVKRQAQDISGGIVETGCMPSHKDFSLTEWLTIGGGVPGCMHGGGSPDGAKLVVRFKTPLEEYVAYAQKIMGIDEKISEPAHSEIRS